MRHLWPPLFRCSSPAHPSFAQNIIELAVYGNSLVEVCQRLLERRMKAARNLGEAAAVLLEVVAGRVAPLYDEVLAACEQASGEDDDFSSLSRASYLLDTLVGYTEGLGREDLLAKLAERVFVRACLLLPAGAEVDDEEAVRVGQGIRSLHQVAGRRAQRGVLTELFAERLLLTAEGSGQVHPSPAGLACAILYLDGRLTDEGLAAELGLRLSRGEEPLKAAQFVEGLFSLNRSVLVRNRALVGNLTDFLVRMEKDTLLAVLPVLRRSLANLTPAEMGYLAETIVEVLGIGRNAPAEAAQTASQMEELGALDDEIGDLFG